MLMINGMEVMTYLEKDIAETDLNEVGKELFQNYLVELRKVISKHFKFERIQIISEIHQIAVENYETVEKYMIFSQCIYKISDDYWIFNFEENELEYLHYKACILYSPTLESIKKI